MTARIYAIIACVGMIMRSSHAVAGQAHDCVVSDPGDGLDDENTLRYCITDVNQLSVPNASVTTITFASTVRKVTLNSSNFPVLKVPITLDGGTGLEPVEVNGNQKVATFMVNPSTQATPDIMVRITNVKFTSFTADGLKLEANAKHTVLKSVTSSGNGNSGIVVQAQFVKVQDCTVLGNSKYGLDVDSPAKELEVSALEANGNGEYGLHVAAMNCDVFGGWFGVTKEGKRNPKKQVYGIYVTKGGGNTNIKAHGSTQAPAVVSGNTKGGIYSNGDGTVVEYAYVGVGVHGNTSVGNGGVGIQLNGVNARVGPADSKTWSEEDALYSIVSGNGGQGLKVNGEGAKIYGALIGVAKDGKTVVGNEKDGLLLYGKDCTVGSPKFKTVFGGNGAKDYDIAKSNWAGIRVRNTKGAVIANVYAGVGLDGESKVPNKPCGIVVDVDSSGCTIDNSVISGNAGDGIRINSGATGTIINHVYLGVNAEGTKRVGNGRFGMYWKAGTSKGEVGSDAAAPVSIISGNAENGIKIESLDLKVDRVYVGVDKTGSKSIPNGESGISIEESGTRVIVGAKAYGRNNTSPSSVVSGNAEYGLIIKAGIVAGILIGTDAVGRDAVPNGMAGISAEGNASPKESRTLVIGAEEYFTVVSGNKRSGIDVTANDVTMTHVMAGVDGDGLTAVPNGGHGIIIRAAAGDTTVKHSVVSGNDKNGIRTDAPGCKLTGNMVGVNKKGLAVPNKEEGIYVDKGAVNTQIAHDPPHMTVVSGNTLSGIRIFANGTKVNTAYVGVALPVNGRFESIPNGIHGIHIEDGANYVRVGSTTASAECSDNSTCSAYTTEFCQNAIIGNLVQTQCPALCGICGAVTAVGCVVGGNTRDGVFIEGNDAIVSSCKIQRNAWAGIYVAPHALDVVIGDLSAKKENVFVTDNGEEGILLNGLDAKVVNAVVSGNQGHGIWIQRTAAYAIISGSTFSRNTFDGLRVEAPKATIGMVTSSSNGMYGVHALLSASGFCMSYSSAARNALSGLRADTAAGVDASCIARNTILANGHGNDICSRCTCTQEEDGLIIGACDSTPKECHEEFAGWPDAISPSRCSAVDFGADFFGNTTAGANFTLLKRLDFSSVRATHVDWSTISNHPNLHKLDVSSNPLLPKVAPSVLASLSWSTLGEVCASSRFVNATCQNDGECAQIRHAQQKPNIASARWKYRAKPAGQKYQTIELPAAPRALEACEPALASPKLCLALDDSAQLTIQEPKHGTIVSISGKAMLTKGSSGLAEYGEAGYFDAVTVVTATSGASGAEAMAQPATLDNPRDFFKVRETKSRASMKVGQSVNFLLIVGPGDTIPEPDEHIFLRLDELCADDASFTDAHGRSCSFWSASSNRKCKMGSLTSFLGYEQSDFHKISARCPFACGLCESRLSNDDDESCKKTLDVTILANDIASGSFGFGEPAAVNAAGNAIQQFWVEDFPEFMIPSVLTVGDKIVVSADVVRSGGLYGRVKVEWALSMDDKSPWQLLQGTELSYTFADQQKVATLSATLVKNGRNGVKGTFNFKLVDVAAIDFDTSQAAINATRQESKFAFGPLSGGIDEGEKHKICINCANAFVAAAGCLKLMKGEEYAYLLSNKCTKSCQGGADPAVFCNMPTSSTTTLTTTSSSVTVTMTTTTTTYTGPTETTSTVPSTALCYDKRLLKQQYPDRGEKRINEFTFTCYDLSALGGDSRASCEAMLNTDGTAACQYYLVQQSNAGDDDQGTAYGQTEYTESWNCDTYDACRVLSTEIACTEEIDCAWEGYTGCRSFVEGERGPGSGSGSSGASLTTSTTTTSTSSTSTETTSTTSVFDASGSGDAVHVLDDDVDDFEELDPDIYFVCSQLTKLKNATECERVSGYNDEGCKFDTLRGCVSNEASYTWHVATEPPTTTSTTTTATTITTSTTTTTKPPCEPNPCMNRATCTAADGNFTCAHPNMDGCAPGLSGKTCGTVDICIAAVQYFQGKYDACGGPGNDRGVCEIGGCNCFEGFGGDSCTPIPDNVSDDQGVNDDEDVYSDDAGGGGDGDDAETDDDTTEATTTTTTTANSETPSNCAWFSEDPARCDAYGSVKDVENILDANTACCACGGGTHDSSEIIFAIESTSTTTTTKTTKTKTTTTFTTVTTTTSTSSTSSTTSTNTTTTTVTTVTNTTNTTPTSTPTTTAIPRALVRLYFDAAAHVGNDVIAAVFAEVNRTWPEVPDKLSYLSIDPHADGASLTLVGGFAAATKAGIAKDVQNCTFCLALASTAADGQKGTAIVCASDGPDTAACTATPNPACTEESRQECPSNSACKPQADGALATSICACPLDSSRWCAVVATADRAKTATTATTTSTSTSTTPSTSTSTPAAALSLRLKCEHGLIEPDLFARLVVGNPIVDTFEYDLGYHLKSTYGSQIGDDLVFEFDKFDPRQGGSVMVRIFAEGRGGSKKELESFDAITATSLFRLDSFVFAGSRVCTKAAFKVEELVTSTTVSAPTEPRSTTTATPAGDTSAAGAGIGSFELTEEVITLMVAGGGVLLVLVIIAVITCKRKSKQNDAKKKRKAIKLEREQAQARVAHMAAQQQQQEQRLQLQQEQAELQKQRQWQWNSTANQFTSMQPGAVRYAGHSLSPPSAQISWLDGAHTNAARGFHGTAWDSAGLEPTEESYL